MVDLTLKCLLSILVIAIFSDTGSAQSVSESQGVHLEQVADGNHASGDSTFSVSTLIRERLREAAARRIEARIVQSVQETRWTNLTEDQVSDVTGGQAYRISGDLFRQWFFWINPAQEDGLVVSQLGYPLLGANTPPEGRSEGGNVATIRQGGGGRAQIE